MSNAFADALKVTLAWEGAWSNDPQDPGGATMRGDGLLQPPSPALWGGGAAA